MAHDVQVLHHSEEFNRRRKLLGEYFRNYYKQHLTPPSSLHMREFGFGFEKKIDFRHKAFATEAELQAFIQREAPFFMSFSAAYYRYPDAQPMAKKEYLGADLIFDLDASYEHEDHNPLLCTYCQQRVRADTVSLVEDFLLGDFGFSEKEIAINFSGQKGYHLHLEGEAFRQLDADARKQLLAYVTGSGVKASSLLHRERVPGKSTKVFKGPTAASKGWARKLYAKVRQLVGEGTPEQLKHAGFTRGEAGKIVARREFYTRQVEQGNWDTVKASEAWWEEFIARSVSMQSVNVDRSVSFDLARLIRLPDSLHGDTGFVARTISLAELKKFEPGSNAVAFKGEKGILVRTTDAAEIELMGRGFTLKAQTVYDLPDYAAIFLLCKKKATLA